jgi:hypothetical protein
VIRDLLFDSVVDGATIRDLVTRSKYYSAAKNEPVWRALWNAMSRSDREAQDAVDEVEQMFQTRAFTDQGEMLHVFGERLWLSRIKAIAPPLTDVVTECKRYIDDVYTAKEIDPAKSMRDVLGNATESYDGLMFMEHESKEFGEIVAHLHAAENQAQVDSYPAKSQELLKVMETDTELFFRQLCLTNSNDNIYAQVPILPAIDPAEFVARVIALPPEYRRTALMPFAQRYTYLNIAPQLIPELAWLENVKKGLENEIAKLPPIAKHALSGTLGRYVTLPLQAAHAMAAALAPPPAATP